MKVVFIFFLGVVISPSLLATDTLIYRSGFEERQIGRAMRNNDVDYAALYLAIALDSSDYLGHVASLNTFFRELTPWLNEQKTNKQKAVLIFKEVHGRFFRQYDENVTFNRIFEDGVYNCVTASMLYAIVLKYYAVPFEIKEKPQHVYLVAFPGSDNILFETTNPKGIFAPDEKSKSEYVNGLIAMKFTTTEHVNAVGVASAFNEFYYNNETISPTQLAGLQYYNLAILQNEKKLEDEAIRSAMKMNMLYDCPKHQYLKVAYISSAIHNSRFDTKKDILYLCEFANSTRDVSDKKEVTRSFDQLINEQLFKNSNEAFVTEAYGIIISRFKDNEMLKEITYSYTFGMSYWLSMKGNPNKSLEFAGKAYAMNPKDVRMHEVIVRDIVLSTEKLKGKQRQKSVDILKGYATKFPFLASHTTFRALMIYQLAFASYGLFLENKDRDGYKYLDQMELAIKQNNGSTLVSEHMIGMAYAEAGAYHFRKREYKEAKRIILKGLEIVPDHGELKERLRIVESEKN